MTSGVNVPRPTFVGLTHALRPMHKKNQYLLRPYLGALALFHVNATFFFHRAGPYVFTRR